MTARKRKPNSKYEEETPVKKPRTSTEVPSKRAPVPRGAKVNRNDPEWLVTQEKSPLAYENLHITSEHFDANERLQAELSNPKTYEGFTKEDWEDLRSTLPENVPLNPDGYSISTNFLKYDPDFRNGVREFQEDLGSGRLDPKWMAAAAEAMEERANGDFDAWKEKEYEEFWGQKQKLAYDALAGESTTLKLDFMIEHGVFRVGDEFVYARAIGRGKKKVLLEKECRITSLGPNTMTLAIPPGRQKFARQNSRTPVLSQSEPSAQATQLNGGDTRSPPPDIHKEDVKVLTPIETQNGRPTKTTPISDPVLGDDELGLELTPPKDGSDVGMHSSTDVDVLPSNTPPVIPHDDTILLEIKSLKQLNDKIIELDGRLDPKNQKEAPAVSPWKLIRAKRNNQDLGTLFEMREEFYVYKLPQINKSLEE